MVLHENKKENQENGVYALDEHFNFEEIKRIIETPKRMKISDLSEEIYEKAIYIESKY